MDATTTQIAEFAANADFDALPDAVVEACRVRIVDTVGCALGGSGSPTAEAADAVAVRVSPEARGDGLLGWQLGRPGPDLPLDMAAFLNTTMIRYLDFNDWYPGGHPSDTIGGLLAFAGVPGVTGRRLLTATVVSYEVFSRITRDSGLRKLGFDQGFAMGVATSAAMGNLLGLSVEQIGAAVGVMAASGVPTRATRSGQLSMWKGCATAYATRNAAFVVQLARAGMSGPPGSFEGRNGIHDLVTGGFTLEPFGTTEADHHILDTALKYWPVCYHLQAPVWAGLELRDAIGSSEIAKLTVGTYWEAWRDTGSEPDKWDPKSRETADHSLPYVLARSLTHGPVDAEAFAPSAFGDPELRPLMDKIAVEVDDDIQAAFPDRPTVRVTATLADGSTMRVEVANPAGHPGRPLSREQLRAKFSSLALAVVGDRESADRLFETWWDAVTEDRPVPMAGWGASSAVVR